MLSPSERPGSDPAPLAAVEGAWDCHIHVFGPPARYPLAPTARYKPGEAGPEDARDHARRIGVRRLVLIQASPYADDNRCLLDALAALGPENRGVVALQASTLDDTTLTRLHAAGVRGVRLNPNGGIRAVEEVSGALQALTRQLRGTGWHIELNAPADLAGELVALAGAGEVPLVFDHLLGLDLAASDFERSLERVVVLVSREPVWVKASGVSRSRLSPVVRANQAAATRRLLACAPDRIVWGSDWPHTPFGGGPDGFRAVDDPLEAAVALAASGNGAGALFRDNPQRLYG